MYVESNKIRLTIKSKIPVSIVNNNSTVSAKKKIIRLYRSNKNSIKNTKISNH